MSLSWRDRVTLRLAPDSWALSRTPGLRPRRRSAPAAGRCVADPAAPIWRAAVDAAGSALRSPNWSNAAIEVMLADELLRYQVVAWQSGLSGEDEETALARIQFRRVYGAPADDWVIRVAPAAPGRPRLACAIDAALLAALNTLAGAGGPVAIRPHFVVVANALRRRLGGGLCALAVTREHHVTLGVLARGRWLAVSGRRLDRSPVDALPELLAREQLRGNWPSVQGVGITVGARAPGDGTGWIWRRHDAAELAWA